MRDLGLAAVTAAVLITAALIMSACATTSYTAAPAAPERVGIVAASVMLDPAQAPRYTRDAIRADRAGAAQIAAAAAEAAPSQAASITRAAIEAAPEQADAIRRAVSRVQWTLPARVSDRVPQWAEVQRIVERAGR